MKYLLLLFFVFGLFGGVLGQTEHQQQSIEFWKEVNKLSSDTAKVAYISNLDDKRIYLQNPQLSKEILEFGLQMKNKLDNQKRYKGLSYKIIMYHYLLKMDLATTIIYADSALLFLEGIDKHSPLFEKAQCLMFMGEVTKAESIFNSLLKEEIGNRTKFMILRLFAASNIRKGNYDSVYILLDKLKLIYEEENNEEYKANTQDIKCMLYTELKMYDSALINFKEIEKYKVKLDAKGDIARLYTNMANVYKDYKKYDYAEEYYNKALKIIKEMGSTDTGIVYYQLAALYSLKQDLKMEVKYLKQALDSYEKVGDTEGVAYTKESLGLSSTKLKFQQGQNNYEEEIKMELEALDFFRKQNNKMRIVGSGSFLCNIYIYANKIDKAKELIEELNNYKNLNLETIMRFKKAELKLKLALEGVEIKAIQEIMDEDIQQLLVLQDSVAFLSYDKEEPRKLAEIKADRAKLETLQKEKQIIEEQLKQDKILYWSGSGLLVLVLGGGLGFLLFRQRAKRKTLEERVKSTDEAYSKITTILHDELSADIGLASNQLEILKTLDTETQMRIVTDLEVIRERVRNLSHEVSYAEDNNLADYIDNYLPVQKAKHSSIAFDLIVEPYPSLIKNVRGQTAHCMYVAIRETVNNAVKYAKPKEIMIFIKLVDENIQVEISDNGKGFDVSKAKKTGLNNLKERALLLKGTFDISSDPQNGGTKAILSLPIEEQNN